MADAVKKLPSIGNILSTSIEAAKAHAGAYFRVLGPYVGLAILQVIVSSLIPVNQTVFGILAIVVTIATIAYGIYMGIVLTRISYQAVMANKVDEAKAKKDVAKAVVPMIVVGIITGFLTLLGLIFFIVPGIIVGLMFFAAQYLVIIDGVPIGESLKKSKELTAGRKGDLFVKLLVTHLVIGFVYVLAVGITGGVLGGVGSLASEEVAGILAEIGSSLVAMIFIPPMTNISTYIFGHLKK